MCWGVIGRIIDIKGEFQAVVDFGGVKRDVLIGVEDVSIGEYVLVHAGVIITKLTERDVLENMAFYRDLIYYHLLDLGIKEGDALKKAEEEIKEVTQSLGLKPEAIPKEVTSKNEEEKPKLPLIPSNAFKRRYKVSLSDTDYLQVMHYTNYFRYCERAQQELLEELGFSYSTLIHRYGLFIPTVESTGRFKAPIRLDNEIEVAVWVEEIGRKHIKWKCIIINLASQKVAGECRIVSVCTDTTLMESMELPKDLKEKLKRYVSQSLS